MALATARAPSAEAEGATPGAARWPEPDDGVAQHNRYERRRPGLTLDRAAGRAAGTLGELKRHEGRRLARRQPHRAAVVPALDWRDSGTRAVVSGETLRTEALTAEADATQRAGATARALAPVGTQGAVRAREARRAGARAVLALAAARAVVRARGRRAVGGAPAWVADAQPVLARAMAGAVSGALPAGAVAAAEPDVANAYARSTTALARTVVSAADLAAALSSEPARAAALALDARAAARAVVRARAQLARGALPSLLAVARPTRKEAVARALGGEELSVLNGAMRLDARHQQARRARRPGHRLDGGHLSGRRAGRNRARGTVCARVTMVTEAATSGGVAYSMARAVVWTACDGAICRLPARRALALARGCDASAVARAVVGTAAFRAVFTREAGL